MQHSAAVDHYHRSISFTRPHDKTKEVFSANERLWGNAIVLFYIKLVDSSRNTAIYDIRRWLKYLQCNDAIQKLLLRVLAGTFLLREYFNSGNVYAQRASPLSWRTKIRADRLDGSRCFIELCFHGRPRARTQWPFPTRRTHTRAGAGADALTCFEPATIASRVFCKFVAHISKAHPIYTKLSGCGLLLVPKTMMAISRSPEVKCA